MWRARVVTPWGPVQQRRGHTSQPHTCAGALRRRAHSPVALFHGANRSRRRQRCEPACLPVDAPGTGADVSAEVLLLAEPESEACAGEQGEKQLPPPPLASWWRGLPPRVRGLLLLNLLTLLFGSNVAVVKGAQEALGPWAFSAGRFAFAAVAFAPCLPAAVADEQVLAAGAELGAIAAAGYGLQAWALTETSAGHTAFLGAFTVLLVPILAGISGRAIPGRTWAATAVALVGISVLELGDLAEGSTAVANSLAGDVAALASAGVFAWQILRTEHHVGRLGLTSSARAPALIAAQLATLAALFAVAAGADANLATTAGTAGAEGATGAAFNMSDLPLFAWLYTGLVSTAGTLWLELEALRDVSAPDAALVYSTEPVWGALAAVLLLGEQWGPATYGGAGLILAGSLLGQLNAESEPPPPGGGEAR